MTPGRAIFGVRVAMRLRANFGLSAEDAVGAIYAASEVLDALADRGASVEEAERMLAALIIAKNGPVGVS